MCVVDKEKDGNKDQEPVNAEDVLDTVQKANELFDKGQLHPFLPPDECNELTTNNIK